MGVETFAMRARHTLVAPVGNTSVKINNIMIAYSAESALPVPAVNVVDRYAAPCRSGGAVNDNLIYFSHNGGKVNTSVHSRNSPF